MNQKYARAELTLYSALQVHSLQAGQRYAK